MASGQTAEIVRATFGRGGPKNVAVRAEACGRWYAPKECAHVSCTIRRTDACLSACMARGAARANDRAHAVRMRDQPDVARSHVCRREERGHFVGAGGEDGRAARMIRLRV